MTFGLILRESWQINDYSAIPNTRQKLYVKWAKNLIKIIQPQFIYLCNLNLIIACRQGVAIVLSILIHVSKEAIQYGTMFLIASSI